MQQRRILSLWFPRLDAERVMRAEPQLADRPLGIVAEAGGALVLASLGAAAEAAGLRRGMALGDARAICPDLVTRPEDALRAADFLAALRRWAGRFSPWVAAEGREALVLDVTGCAHLFGGEAGLAETVEAGAAGLGLSLRLGIADTLGAAWAVARFAGAGPGPVHAGDAIDQEARATRSRAQKRRWERGGAAPPVAGRPAGGCRIVPPGETRAHLGPLPVAALRLGVAEIQALQGLGLRRIEDVAVLPRAQLARRLGPEVVRRLDQALGRAPEPVSPARPEHVFALRLTFPEPIGLEADVLAGLDRLLPPLCARLRAAGRGARRLRLTLMRVDGGAETRELGLARPADAPEAIRPLLALKLGDIDAGFGIEVLRLEAVAVEPLSPRQHRGQLAASAAAAAARQGGDPEGMAELLGRIGARLGLDSLTRLHPAESHLPEKGATVMAAAYSAPARDWPAPAAPRPIVIFPPEPVTPRDGEAPPRDFVWRRRALRRAAAFGPERIAPEWWLDDPAWRSGPRDYWRVETEAGDRLWLFEARGGEAPAGWFAQGIFA
ncbi:MAG TPA: DNA polymerase Y family protein [Amaricoccus sp.]|uniref:Y-family DNA polymerase n=1 Tax=Amaricoccus sp. TaxID=1872485 RepID=UPI002B7B11DF|nr:DNA polymerase Y family protein [Amaricoccus sp.]HPG21924.1 DNA polymerase Y family protein [Amaricoccus sp.]HRW14573.1 DNA polymerase Y family protein [Amaricoccus sp.]